MPVKSKKNYIIQFGSGKPGEMGTGKTELEVFDLIGLKNPKIGFAPFHHILHHQVNDWSLFLYLVQPITKKKIELFEFHKEKDMKSLKKRISSCDIFILGSGICEPYLEFIFSNRLDKFFMDSSVMCLFSSAQDTAQDSERLQLWAAGCELQALSFRL